jgi:hypothetical protein
MADYKIPGGVVITRSDVEQYKREILEASTLVRAEEAVQILACSPRTLHGLVQAGKLPAYRHGSARSSGMRYLARDLQNYVKSRQVRAEDYRE